MLTVQTFAGHMHTTVIDPPPPTEDGQMTTTAAGQMDTTSNEADEPVTQIALNILQSVLSIF
jgi:hypothetical protein